MWFGVAVLAACLGLALSLDSPAQADPEHAPTPTPSARRAQIAIGSLVDSDGDLVPDQFDNCTLIPNGPHQNSNQVDTDRDGYGNACDADYSGDTANFEVDTADFATFLFAFTGGQFNPETDHDGDGVTTGSDMSIFLAMFQGTRTLGPGLPCAGAENCVP